MEGFPMRRILLFVGLAGIGVILGLRLQAEQGKKTVPAAAAPQRQGEAKLITVTYAVADLVVPIAYNLDAPKPQDEARPNPATDPNQVQPTKIPDEKTPYVTQENALIRLICAVVAPDSWRKEGKQATIEYFPLGMGLVIRQTKEAHEEIVDLLASLRRLQDLEVAVELRLVSVPDAASEKILGPLNATVKGQITYLDETQKRTLLDVLQNDKRAEVLQAPKITVFNGQRGCIAVSDWQFFLTGVSLTSANGQSYFTPNNVPTEIGFRSTICPTVSADRQSVLLDLQTKRTTLSEPVPLIPMQIPVPKVSEDGKKAKDGETAIFQMFFQQPKIATQIVDQKFSIPTGKTALIVAGKEQRQTRLNGAVVLAEQALNWAGIPADFAYSRETCTTILLVTPRIIVNDESKDSESKDSPHVIEHAVGN
jgi:hypothetical protein